MAEPQPWSIREAGAGDIAALSLVASATFLETFAGVLPGAAIVVHCATAYAPDRFADYFARGSRAWILEATPGGAPVGFAQLAVPDLPGAGPGDVELKRIYLLSRFHGSGAGGALMAAAAAGAAGHARLLLGVYARNAPALAFYGKQGFVPVGERRFDVGGQLFDDVVLARPLAA